MLIGISACKKDQFTTKPQLKFKSVSPQVLYPNQVIEFQIEYSDKEGIKTIIDKLQEKSYRYGINFRTIDSDHFYINNNVFYI